MLRITGAGLLMVVGLLVPAIASALDAPPGKWWHLPRIVDHLRITDQEQQTLDRLFLENRRELITLKGQLEIEQLELEHLLDQDPMNEPAVMEQFRKLQEARSRLGLATFQFILQVRKTLGYERFQRLRQIHNITKKKRGQPDGDSRLPMGP
jgi:Spy/CpxP family protein refolding chaperone